MIESLTAPKTKCAFAADVLPDHPLFDGLGQRDRHILAECAMRATFQPGALIVETGQPANCIYLVVSGLIALETRGTPAPLRVQSIGPGDVLGWSWLFPPYYWHFNGIAEQETETLFFYGSRLQQECDRNHEFGYELLKRMSKILLTRLESTRDKWIDAAQFASPRMALPADYLII